MKRQRNLKMKNYINFGLTTALLTLPQITAAQGLDTTPTNSDIGYIFTTFMFLVTGFLVFFMAAGFAMLEAGLVRGKNVAMQLTKNVALFSLAALFYYILGYNLSSTKTPRHAKSYKNFNKIHNDIQKERINAFKKFQLEVTERKFPLKKHSIMAEKKELEKFKKLIKKNNYD